MDIDPTRLTDALRSKLLTGLVVPRPIAVVSTVSAAGQLNLAPFSYFNVASDTPMALMFSLTGPKPDQSEKDTLRNVRGRKQGGTGEFVINVATENYAPSIAAAGASLPYGESEFDYARLAKHPSLRVKPPGVAAARARFECRTRRIVRIGHAHLVIGTVLHLWVSDELLDEGMRVDTDKLGAIGRLAGYDYCRTADRFQQVTGTRPPEEHPGGRADGGQEGGSIRVAEGGQRADS